MSNGKSFLSLNLLIIASLEQSLHKFPPNGRETVFSLNVKFLKTAGLSRGIPFKSDLQFAHFATEGFLL